ncbi:hypothetical protein DIE19_33555 [Burkholderia sp. Bp9126]|nr:hypothetical protein DIE19_33555 [Burkholderia sp. Bp9126]
MEDGRQLTLVALAAIKKQRERSLRAMLARLAQQEAELLVRRASLLDTRHTLWTDWRNATSVDAVHSHESLQDLKCELASFYHRDQALAEQIEAIDKQRQSLRLEHAGQLDRLHKVIIDQDKLGFLLE